MSITIAGDGYAFAQVSIARRIQCGQTTSRLRTLRAHRGNASLKLGHELSQMLFGLLVRVKQ